MKRRLIIILSAVCACIIVACVLFLAGVIRFNNGTVPASLKPVAYLEYMNANMLIDKNMYVTGSSTDVPEGIPKVTGLDFDQILVHSRLVVINESAADYAMEVVSCVHKNALDIAEIYIAPDLTATLYVGNIKILLGADNGTAEKFHDLRDFYDEVRGLSGVLDMQELSKNNLGYSFKTN